MKKAIDAYNRQLRYITSKKEFCNSNEKTLLEKLIGIIMKITGNKEEKEKVEKDELNKELTRHHQFVEKLQETDNIGLINQKENNKTVEKEIEYEKE